MATWFTSDTHYGHDAIIQYCNRPYNSVGEMNFDMARRWNERVAPTDTVYHLPATITVRPPPTACD